MKNIKQIDLNNQRELYSKYQSFIEELYLECFRLISGRFVKRAELLYPINTYMNAYITLVTPEKQMSLLKFNVYFSSIEDRFTGEHYFEITRDEILDKNILMFCLNITYFIDITKENRY